MNTNEIKDVLDLLKEIEEDRTVPKNVRTLIENVRLSFQKDSDIAIKINYAISNLDEISNDPNIPVYARTQIWNIVSILESLNKSD